MFICHRATTIISPLKRCKDEERNFSEINDLKLLLSGNTLLLLLASAYQYLLLGIISVLLFIVIVLIKGVIESNKTHSHKRSHSSPQIIIPMSCTNNINASNSDTLHDTSRGIEKVTIADNTDVSRYDDMSATTRSAEEKMNNKKCTSLFEQNLEHTKTNDIGADNTSSDAADIVLETVDIVSGAKEVQTCANCGKGGASNICNKCNEVKYCNAACKKKHKTKHKKACERRVAELHDIELFKQPPPLDGDCPICFVRLPLLCSGRSYSSCCGKEICSGCIHAVTITRKRKTDIPLCPFCRTPHPTTDKEIVKRLMRRVDASDAEAIQIVGGYYSQGQCGLPQDNTKALKLRQNAAELGSVLAYHNLGNAHQVGRGVEIDEKTATYYYELAAMKGYPEARHNLGIFEDNAGNIERALKHYVIAVEGGCSQSLKEIQDLYSRGLATKDVYIESLRSYQKYLVEVKSSQRDEAAAFDVRYKYIE